MTEPITPEQLAAIRERDHNAIARFRPPDPPADWATNPSARSYLAYRERAWFDAEHDRRTLLDALEAAEQRARDAEAKLDGQAWDDMETRLQRVRDLCDRAIMHDHDGFPLTYVSWIRKALDGPTDDEDQT